MKKFETILYAIVLILALATIPMMALAETAVTESPYVDPYDLFTPLGESSNSDYGPCGQEWVAATKDGIEYWLCAKPGAQFLFTVTLPKVTPFVAPGGTWIDYAVIPYDEDSTAFYDDWVDIDTTHITEDDSIEIVFRITAPDDIPNELYEFWAVTDGLEPQIGTTILKITISDDLS